MATLSFTVDTSNVAEVEQIIKMLQTLCPEKAANDTVVVENEERKVVNGPSVTAAPRTVQVKPEPVRVVDFAQKSRLEVAESPPTKEAIIEAAKDLRNRHGPQALITLLAQFRAQRIGEIPEDKGRDFIKLATEYENGSECKTRMG